MLLSEDEQDVREIAREFLESGGYTVIEAKNGREAIELAEKYGEKIDLLVTDMVMPGMTGQELAVRLQAGLSGAGSGVYVRVQRTRGNGNGECGSVGAIDDQAIQPVGDFADGAGDFAGA